ncbi:MAG TPA: hypothetical protein VJ692_05340, partial [Nitrospiraceae bacterium]|nr:hypothetical protein [Nitrospiraceae bacterium]
MMTRQHAAALAFATTLMIDLFIGQRAYADHPHTLMIAAANSLKEALRAILPIFEKEQGNAEVKVVW